MTAGGLNWAVCDEGLGVDWSVWDKGLGVDWSVPILTAWSVVMYSQQQCQTSASVACSAVLVGNSCAVDR